MRNYLVKLLAIFGILFGTLALLGFSNTYAQPQSNSGATGIEGTIPTDPPDEPAIITFPANGQSFSQLPITVAGLCPEGLLVAIFKNNVFSGSTECNNGSFSVQIDLFNGRNDLIARVFDALDQAGPDSNTVTVNFDNALPGSGPRVSITTSYTKIGANPGDTLNWPITISGGTGPYAISVDWGDKTALDLISQAGAGNLTLKHIYDQAGVYNITIKVTDAQGEAAFLQVVGIGNGPIEQDTTSTAGGSGDSKAEKEVLWWPFLVTLVLTIIAFWLGSRHQLETIRERLRHGERPFK